MGSEIGALAQSYSASCGESTAFHSCGRDGMTDNDLRILRLFLGHPLYAGALLMGHRKCANCS